jgi:peptide deformylase
MPEKVRLINDPVLRKPTSPVDLLDMTSMPGLLDMMHDTMKAEGGIGLAANQIGHSISVFILKKDDSFQEYINPEILGQEDLVPFEGEGCLSIPGTNAITKRFKHVKLAWYDKNGIRIEGSFEGLQAFAVQHEMDHLNGKLYTDQLSPLKRDMVLSKHRKFLKGY